MKSKLLRALSVFMCVVVLAESVDCSLLADAQGTFGDGVDGSICVGMSH